MNAQLQSATAPRRFYAVVRPECDSALIYPTREHAEAICAARRFEYPTLGPWDVVALVEDAA